MLINTVTNVAPTGGFSLEPLPYPVYFVCPNPKKWQDLLDCPTLPQDISPLLTRCEDVADIWSVQAYLLLKQRGLDVRLVQNFIPDQICLSPFDHLSPGKLAFNSYVVACRHDRARPEICEQRIVINELNVIDQTDLYVPHWTQPNLLPRDRQRGARVESLVFKGIERNLAFPFKAPEFKQQLQDLGINFVVTPDDPALQFADWVDYRQADVAFAVRNNTEYDLSLKPALKLLNAWVAGCPAILGPEPAYQTLRQSELDYIEVRTVAEVIEALQRLKADPTLYEAMVENGLKRAQAFTDDRIAQIWRDHLAGSIATGYERWQRQPRLFKVFGRPVQHLVRTLRHKRNIKDYWTQIFQGARLFGEEPTNR
jgi:hypothetical protein